MIFYKPKQREESNMMSYKVVLYMQGRSIPVPEEYSLEADNLLAATNMLKQMCIHGVLVFEDDPGTNVLIPISSVDTVYISLDEDDE
jgi:hypothetical protein